VSIIENINKTFDNRVRLGIMSALMVNESVDFNTLKELLDVTDGNLANHIKALEKVAYILIQKQFIGKKTNTKYSVTKLGKMEFKKHITALEKLISHKPFPKIKTSK
jgi:DNA-binding MarR family transcriptional regulator